MVNYLGSVLNKYDNCGLFSCGHYFLAGFLVMAILLLFINFIIYRTLSNRAQRNFPETSCGRDPPI